MYFSIQCSIWKNSALEKKRNFVEQHFQTASINAHHFNDALSSRNYWRKFSWKRHVSRRWLKTARREVKTNALTSDDEEMTSAVAQMRGGKLSVAITSRLQLGKRLQKEVKTWWELMRKKDFSEMEYNAYGTNLSHIIFSNCKPRSALYVCSDSTLLLFRQCGWTWKNGPVFLDINHLYAF